MTPILRATAWLIASASAAGPALALRTTLDCAPIRMLPLAQADIRLGPVVREGPKLSPAPPADIRVAPMSPQTLRLPSAEDAEVTQELNRLKSRAAAVSPSDRRSRPAARANAAEAAWTLGLIHLHGAGAALDPATARQWFDLAYRLGHPQAAGGLAWCEIDGCGGPGNAQAARSWLAQLRRTQPERAAYLEWLLNRQNAPVEMAAPAEPGTAADSVLAQRDLLLRAARAGDTQARNELGLELAYAMQLEEALAYFKAASAQSPAAQVNVGIIEDLLDQGKKVDTPASRATELLAQAKRLHRGEGVPANYNEAIRLYREAESQGSAEAGRMMALILSRPTPGGTLDVAWMRQLAWMDMSSSVPRLGSPAIGSVLQRDATPLFDRLGRTWQQRVLKIRSR